MVFDSKIAVVVRDDLATWQKVNVASFLCGGLAGQFPEIVGERYVDADGQAYGPMIRQPILVFGAPGQDLARIRVAALADGLSFPLYTEELFRTGHDDANRAAVRAVAGADLNLVGLVLYAPKKRADRLVKGLKLLS